MRGRPEEHDREQVQGRQIHVVRDRGPTDERWDRPGRPADHDVLHGGALEPERVDEDVDERAAEREQRREQVRDRGQQHEGEDVQDHADCHGDPAGHPMTGQRPPRGTAHTFVEVAVEVVVQRRCATAREGAAEHRRDHQVERRHAPGREEHATERGDQEQGHDGRLGQRDEVLDRGRRLRAHRPPRERGERHHGAPQRGGHGRMRPEGPWRKAGERIERSDGDLQHEQDGSEARGETEPGDLMPAGPAAHDGIRHDDPDRRGHIAVGHVDGCGPTHRYAVVAERPGRAGGGRAVAADVGTGEHQDERAEGRAEGEPGERRRLRETRRGSRPAKDDRIHREDREQQLRVGEMDRDPGVRKLEQHGDRAEDRLQPIEDDRDADERDRPAIVAVPHERPECERRERQAGDDREGPVEPFDAGRDIERRQELAVAQRPIGTAEA